MTFKEALDKMVKLVDNIIVDFSDGREIVIPMEDASLIDNSELLESEVVYIKRLPLHDDYCVIYMD